MSLPANSSTPARQSRYDGWTPARRQAFLDLLRDGVDVQRATARLGMSRRSVYHLRKRDADFAQAWDAALRQAREETGRRLIAELVRIAPWARAAFPEAVGDGVEGFPPGHRDSVTPV